MTYQPKHILMKNFLAVSRGYFDRHAKPGLEKTQATINPVTKHYTIAGNTIRVLFYGGAVANSLSLAIMHHEIEPREHPDLTIYAWDSATADTPLPAPWDEPNYKEESAHPSDSFFGVYIGGEESLNFYDTETKTGYFWTQDARQLPDWAAGAPFRTTLHWFLNERDIHLMHGAVVGHHGKSVLITAKSGSGKSTTALSCILSGMDYLADDYVATKLTDDGVTAISLYNSAKVTREGLELFPELKPGVWNPDFADNEKAVLFMSRLFPDQVKRELPLAAILIPRIRGGETKLVTASKIEALVAIAPTTLLQLPLAETNKIGAFKDIIQKVPCYFLDLGVDVRGVPEVIKKFLGK